ncbi:AAA family ATPase [Actinomycetes bacterium M1A6_2h]
MTEPRLTLIVVGGLPAVGKTTVSQQLARHLGAPYIRIDTIEKAIVTSGVAAAPGSAGYVVGYALAAEQLHIGSSAVVECVNGLDLTRRSWRRVANKAGADVLEVELICSDRAEHRRRAQSRVVDIPGLTLPTWRDIVAREYEPWPEQHLVIDTASTSPADAVRSIVDRIRY